MIVSTHCPLCHSKNNGVWVLINLNGENKKVCKLCVDKNAPEPFDLSMVQRTKERVEAERKAKNAEIIKALKNKTLITPRDPWRG